MRQYNWFSTINRNSNFDLANIIIAYRFKRLLTDSILFRALQAANRLIHTTTRKRQGFFDPAFIQDQAFNLEYNSCLSILQNVYFIPKCLARDPFTKSAFKCRLEKMDVCVLYLNLLYRSFHSSLLSSSFSSTCMFSSKGTLLSFIWNVAIGNLSEVHWESDIRKRFSFRNLWRKEGKSCRNSCEF